MPVLPGGSAALWDALNAGQQQVMTSDLTLLEVLVKPLGDGNKMLADLFRSVLFGTAGLTCMPISRAVLETAAQLRVQHQLKTPDAIHAATCLDSGCALLVTNDSGLRRITGLNVAVLREIASS